MDHAKAIDFSITIHFKNLSEINAYVNEKFSNNNLWYEITNEDEISHQ